MRCPVQKRDIWRVEGGTHYEPHGGGNRPARKDTTSHATHVRVSSRAAGPQAYQATRTMVRV